MGRLAPGFPREVSAPRPSVRTEKRPQQVYSQAPAIGSTGLRRGMRLSAPGNVSRAGWRALIGSTALANGGRQEQVMSNDFRLNNSAARIGFREKVRPDFTTLAATRTAFAACPHQPGQEICRNDAALAPGSSRCVSNFSLKFARRLNSFRSRELNRWGHVRILNWSINYETTPSAA